MEKEPNRKLLSLRVFKYGRFNALVQYTQAPTINPIVLFFGGIRDVFTRSTEIWFECENPVN